MFLSQLLVNMGDDPDKPRPGMAWIKETYRVHQRIWMAFPDEQRITADPFFLGEWHAGGAKPKRSDAGFLFRIEPDRPTRILVQSVQKPNWDYAFQNAPHLLAGSPQVREYEPSFKAGQTLRFRLVMQMVKRRTVPTGKLQEGQKAKSEHPIRCLLPAAGGSDRRAPDPNFTAWKERLNVAAERSGFNVGTEPSQLRVQSVTNLYMKPEGGDTPHRFNAAMFEGLLTCTDPLQLREAVINGIGRGKAFGMGLLSLAVLK
jgi:CRISPR system Cascade subunit CasE